MLFRSSVGEYEVLGLSALFFLTRDFPGDEGPHFQPDPQQPLLRRYFANFCICAWDVNCNFDASLAVISFPGVSHCVFGNSLMEFGIAHELYR
jgi:hypothetical protein